MCFGHASIFYGLFVTGCDVCAASDAWKRLKPAFLAVDLIVLRRSKGTLKTEEGGARLSEVPDEVWTMVKHELAGVEVARAAREIAMSFRCELCEEQRLVFEHPRELWEGGCELCFDDFKLEGGRTESLLEDRSAPFDLSDLTSVPGNAGSRIRSFVKLFRLQVLHFPPDGKDAPASTGTTSRQGKEGMEPRWQLWAASKCAM
ncbi:hypothetical protein JCM6882_000394 [Rhodosporidiobolus microsporus]